MVARIEVLLLKNWLADVVLTGDVELATARHRAARVRVDAADSLVLLCPGVALCHYRVDVRGGRITLILDADVGHGHVLLDVGRAPVIRAL